MMYWSRLSLSLRTDRSQCSAFESLNYSIALEKVNEKRPGIDRDHHAGIGVTRVRGYRAGIGVRGYRGQTDLEFFVE